MDYNEYINAFGEEEARVLLGVPGEMEIPQEKIGSAIAAAREEANSYLAVVGAEACTNAVVSGFVMDLARFRLASTPVTMTKEIKLRAEAAREWFDKVSRGAIMIPTASEAVKFTVAPRRFNRRAW